MASYLDKLKEREGNRNRVEQKEIYMNNISNTLGIWADNLRGDEVEFTLEVAEYLKSVPWAKKMLDDPQIKEALKVHKLAELDAATIKRIKAALFEVRFAFALYDLNVEYEYCCLKNGGSVDFKINVNPNILIELTSLRESDEMKLATKKFDPSVLQGQV